jgi:hypothetical protein
MRDRPISTWLVCVYLIISSTWALIHSFGVLNSKSMQATMATTPLPPAVQVTQYFLTMIVPLVTGAFMYEGSNWARVVYIGWGIANYLLAAIVVPDVRLLIPGLPIFAFISILLLLPGPRAYFLLEPHFS